MTITLFGGMIMQNFIRVGVLISWVHCMSDISTAGTRLLSQTNLKKSTYISFFCMVLFWILLRNICFPLITYYSFLYLVYPAELAAFQMAPNILNLFLVCLCFMHVYWLSMFLKMLCGAVSEGKTDDMTRTAIQKAKMDKAVKAE